ncbi:Rossman fold protein, TIGR00730 family [Chromatiales bacterium (ex Bugula neritina AB1)]|nr:Rossman fold protein, TIGR00730 family [Chromatiales bacterium (ex Bugula neritina AB1)]
MNRLCVFCGSSSGTGNTYLDAANDLGRAMTSRGIDLVYGGASIGVMGAIADSVLRHGGKAYGVIPEHLQGLEISHKGLTELFVVADMHERKAKMADMSDGFVALPGGIGTLEELIEICTWQQLGLHSKATGILNVNHFFDKLLAFLSHTVEEQFLRVQHCNNLLHNSTPDDLLDTMLSFNRNPEHFLSDKLILPDR